MPNSFDREARGPSTRRIFVTGLVFWVIIAVAVVLMIAKSRGALDAFVRVSAELTNVGDGLPVKSDVKFRGVLVGYVAGVVPAQTARPNVVTLNLKPQFATGIPDTVTARVVPSNVFAVSSVQLVDNGGKGAGTVSALRSGTVIQEDQTLPTVLFQTTLNKFRAVMKSIGREPNSNSVGWLTALGEAAQGRGKHLQQAGHDLNDIVNQLNTIVTGEPGPSTLSALNAATAGLRDAAPDLLDALDAAVRPMRTLAEKRSELTNFLSAAAKTTGTIGDAYDNHTDRMIDISTNLTPVLGTLADHSETIRSILSNAQNLVLKVNDKAFNWETNNINAKVIISLTPTRTYVRADCPRYGDLLGPSCFTAPEVPTAPALTPSLGSMGFPLPPGVNENRPNYAPPRGSVLPPEARTGPPLPPSDPAVSPSPADPEPQLPAEAPPLPVAPAGPGVAPQSAVIGGNVGPVGSDQERRQLSNLLGSPVNVATQMLFAPLARGTTASVITETGGPR
ncbi:MCE family protein [Mycolicibacterium sp. 050232]|uniref:MlaD family protein n=1 Tax=Mycolicibacterium sp. 050232 TaxID=3113982 RepID=UPI002E2DC5F7|nr:MCE family protein [Mycolicibacterium sp. 050232]MED5810832.1 MCE family protein [Mycolicibacterium sp. 050232]